MIGIPLVLLEGGLFMMRFLSHRYQLSYASECRKTYCLLPGTVSLGFEENPFDQDIESILPRKEYLPGSR
jgi:hypothetical protein